MIKSFLTFLLIFVNYSGFSGNIQNSNQFSQIPENYLNKVVGAIFIAEGGNNTKYPFGIKSIKTNNPERICRNTVRNNYLRWQQAGKTNDFISFLGGRYCPIGDKEDKNGLNKNWIRNVQRLVDK